MRRIGMDLIHSAQERLARSGEAPTDFDFRDQSEKPHLDGDVLKDEILGKQSETWPKPRREAALKGRDLLSLLSMCYPQSSFGITPL